MQLFFKKIFYSVLLILLVATLLQLAITYRAKGRSVTGHDHFHALNGKDYDIIFLGSSRCVHHYDPKIFKRELGVTSFNLGMDAHGEIPLQILRLNDHIKYNTTPRVVVLNVDPVMGYTSFDISKNDNLGEKHNFSRYAFFIEKNNELIRDYFHYNIGEKYIPLYAVLKYKIISQYASMKNGNDWLVNDGYLNTSCKPWDTSIYRVAEGDKHCRSLTFMKDCDSIKYQLDSFKRLCNKNNITLVCVQSPINDIMYAKAYFDKVGEMCRQLNIPFFDYSQNISFNSDPANFSDQYHMNLRGTDTFCTQLCRDAEFVRLIKDGQSINE